MNRRGFTILELLVASMLLGMLMTVLTMIFNQSSIAWRTGIAGIADLDEVRDNIAAVRVEADNLYIWNNEAHTLLSPWDRSGQLRKRAIDVSGAGTVDEGEKINYLDGKLSISDDLEPKDVKLIGVGSGDSGGNGKTYTVNVKSAGPNRRFDDYDDIWSFPDDFD